MSFLNPYFLIATGGALLPVLYHLVRRTRVETVPFPSLMLLKNRQEEIVRKRRLQDWLLMAIRMLLFGLLALAFARPFWPQEQGAAPAGAQGRSLVLLVDRSMSMRQGEAFAEARAEAVRRIEDAGAESEVSVLAFAEEVRQLTPLERDPALHRRAVESELQAGYQPTRFGPALRRAEEVLQQARGGARQIVLISDFQKNAWARRLDSLTLATGIDFEPVQVGAAPSGNTYLRDVRLTKEQAGGAPQVRFEARVAAMGASVEEEKTVRLIIDGARVDEKTVPAGSLRTVAFQHAAAEEGPRQGVLEVRSPSDALPADDRYHVTYVAGERPRLLLVSGDRGAARGSAFFLERAFGLGTRYRFESAGLARLGQGGLADYDVVMLSNVPALSDDQRRRLRRFVEGGGGLVIALGDRLDAATFSADLQALGVGAIQQTVQQAAAIGDVEQLHPVFDVFSGASQGALWRPSFQQYAQVNPDTSARVIGAYDTGDPFMVERALGQGRVLLMTSAFHTGWTTLPVTEAFVPLAYQLADHAARGALQRRVFTVGEAVPLPGQPGDTWAVRTPAEETYEVTVGEAGAGRFRRTRVPGAYRAERGSGGGSDGGAERFSFSVNAVPGESDLARGAPGDLRAALKRVAKPGFEAQAALAAPTPEDTEQQQHFWKYLILGVVALFAAETFLANRRLG